MMAFIELKNLVKEFRRKDGSPLRVLDGVSFNVRKGEFVTIFGPNGCGKTTLLKILSGMDSPTSGNMKAGKNTIHDLRSYLVFQNPDDSLFNWMDVRNNIEIVNESAGNSEDFLTGIRAGGKTLHDFREFYPYQLSGGLKQLTVIARAFLYNPKLLLLDEPFSSLDFRTSVELEDNLLGIWERSRQTIIYVSHDIDEAVYLADRIVILSNPPARVSRIIKVGLPRPRRQEIKLTPEFQKIKKEVLESFGDAG